MRRTREIELNSKSRIDNNREDQPKGESHPNKQITSNGNGEIKVKGGPIGSDIDTSGNEENAFIIADFSDDTNDKN